MKCIQENGSIVQTVGDRLMCDCVDCIWRVVTLTNGQRNKWIDWMIVLRVYFICKADKENFEFCLA